MIKLGIIGASEGNGHPYSWSAIFNGYQPEIMENCGYPVIPQYLEKQQWPEARIAGAQVSSVWTQDRELSKHIAAASCIPCVCETLEAMLAQVDAVLLARDDAETHWRHAAPFLKAGKPIYIDKPIALSSDDLQALYALEQYPGQIFTCSALRYSTELTLADTDRHGVGEIREIVAFTPKSWDKYSAHIIEPVLRLLPEGDMPKTISRCPFPKNTGKPGSLSVRWNSGITSRLFAFGDAVSNISIRVHGTKGWKELVFTDSFSAFKAALHDFVEGIRTKSVRSPRRFNELVVHLIEEGRK